MDDLFYEEVQYRLCLLQLLLVVLLFRFGDPEAELLINQERSWHAYFNHC